MAVWWNRKKREKELEEEVRAHLEMDTGERILRGEKKEEAESAARREFGNVEIVKETTRDVRGWEWLNRIWTDLRHGTRVWHKSPGFCAVVVLTLALGIGVNTAVFSVIHAVLLAPLPYKDGSRILQIYSRNEAFKGLSLGVSLGDSAEIQRDVRAFSETAVFNEASKNLTGNGDPQVINTASVGTNFIEFLGASPKSGRFFVEAEHHPGGEETAVLSESLWRTRFGSDSNILGKTIRLDGKSYLIIGVAREGFEFPSRNTEVWLPLAPTVAESQDYSEHGYSMLARLRPGATLEQANNELNAIAGRVEKENKSGFGGWTLSAVNLQEFTIADARPALLILLAAVTLVLLIACANVANLFLTRSWQRHKELALRTALGASRWRLAQTLVTESLLLSLAGGALGLALAVQCVGVFRTLAPEGIPRIEELHPDGTMGAFAFLCTLLVGTIFGVLPAMQAAKWDPNQALKETGISGIPARQRLRDAFAMLEIAMALPLLVGAGLLAKGFMTITHTAAGFRTDHVLLMTINLPEEKYSSDDAKRIFVRELLERVRGVVGVENAAVSHFYPLSGELPLSAGFQVEGEPASKQGIGNTETNSVSADYFRTLNIPILRGREFTEQDNAKGAAVVIVNERMAKQVWKDRDPVGSRIYGIGAKKGKPLIVAGIVGDTRDVTLLEAPRPAIYYPLPQEPSLEMNLLVQTNGDIAKLAPLLRESVWRIDKDQPVTSMQTMESLRAQSVGEPKFRALLVGTFAALGIILASIGIYGVVSYSVSLRIREIGVRVAMGAQKKNVMHLVMEHGLRIAGVGIVIGLAGALGLTQFLASLLYGVSARDPWIFVGVTLLLTATAMLACYVPARRAIKVDPWVALRYE